MNSIEALIGSQYHAALDMLQQAVIRCPESLWDDGAFRNRFWHIAFHALYYTHLYLQTSEAAGVPWAKGRESWRRIDMQDPQQPLARDEILAICRACRQHVNEQVRALDLDAPSGFRWLPFSRLELHFYNLRHLQQHVGELCERLGVTAGVEVDWVAMRRD